MSDQEHMSEKQWYQLSSYLDGQLNDRERKAIEDQLVSDPQLQHAYTLLKQNRSLLQNLPRKRAPRNFTLTAEMVGQKKQSNNRWLLFPALSFASVISLALIVLTFVLQPTVGGTPNLAALPSAEMVVQSDGTAEDGSVPPLIYWGGYQAPAYGYGGSPFAGKGGGGSDIPVDTMMMEAQPAAPEIGMPVVEAEQAPLESQLSVPAPVENDKAAESEVEGSQQVEASQGNLILGLPPMEDRGQQTASVNRDVASTSAATQDVRASLQWWIIRGALLILALLSAYGAYRLWKRRHELV